MRITQNYIDDQTTQIHRPKLGGLFSNLSDSDYVVTRRHDVEIGPLNIETEDLAVKMQSSPAAPLMAVNSCNLERQLLCNLNELVYI